MSQDPTGTYRYFAACGPDRSDRKFDGTRDEAITRAHEEARSMHSPILLFRRYAEDGFRREEFVGRFTAHTGPRTQEAQVITDARTHWSLAAAAFDKAASATSAAVRKDQTEVGRRHERAARAIEKAEGKK